MSLILNRCRFNKNVISETTSFNDEWFLIIMQQKVNSFEPEYISMTHVTSKKYSSKRNMEFYPLKQK
jgi:hypothetical protein